MNFEVKFLEKDTAIKKVDLVVTEVKHLLQSIIMTKDINTYQLGSHLRHMLRAHAWKIKMQGIVVDVDCVVPRNKAKTSKMLRGLELTAK